MMTAPNEPAAPASAADQTAPPPMAPIGPVTAQAPAFRARFGRGAAMRGGIAVVAAIAIVASVAVVIGTAPSPAGLAAGASPHASTAPRASGAPHWAGPSTLRGLISGFLGRGFSGPGAIAGPGRGSITISAIDGTSVSLKTADGWSRTITVDGSVKVTEAGQARTLADLRVGQTVRLGERRASGGTFTVTSLVIVVPSVTGQVTAKTASTITVKRFDGTTQVIDVNGSTTYRIAGTSNATLADVTVGMIIVAQGPQASGGTLQALSIRGGRVPTLRPNLPHPRPSRAPSSSAVPQASGTTNG